MLVLAVLGEILSETTDGRSFAVLAAVGLVAMGDCYLELRRKRERDAGFTGNVLHPLTRSPVFTFFVIGVLVGLG